jgi:antibiotic biosynthesis monooxygenase (ABM) superfamily enzyme
VAESVTDAQAARGASSPFSFTGSPKEKDPFRMIVMPLSVTGTVPVAAEQSGNRRWFSSSSSPLRHSPIFNTNPKQTLGLSLDSYFVSMIKEFCTTRRKITGIHIRFIRHGFIGPGRSENL